MRILVAGDAPYIHTKRWLAQFRNDGHEVHVASFRSATLPGVKLHHLHTFGLGKAAYLLHIPTMRLLARRLRPDVIHAHYVTSYGFVSAVAGLHPLVSTVWGSDVLIAPQHSPFLRFAARYALRNSSMITVTAEHMKPATYALNIGSPEIHVIPFGVDTSVFRPPEREVGVSASIHLICTRNFKPIYDVQTFVRALALLRRTYPAITATLLGEGPLQGELEALVKLLGLDDVIQFLGHVDPARVAICLAESDIFVTASWSDSNNVSLTEAMACGCFPVGSDIPASREWIVHGENGFLFPPGNAEALAAALKQAIADPALRLRARQKNRHIVETRANWQTSVQMTYALFDRLVPPRAGLAIGVCA